MADGIMLGAGKQTTDWLGFLQIAQAKGRPQYAERPSGIKIYSR
jgi:hypothetical protein